MVVIRQGDGLVLVHADLARHDVVAYDTSGDQTRPWCGFFAPGACPLFWTPLIGAGRTAPVEGLDQVRAGRTYRFYCTIHEAAMQGSLVVL